MDIRRLSPDFAVSPQIDADDMAAIAAAGFQVVICNRPDAEVPPQQSAAAIKAAADAAGLRFVDNPVTHHGLNPDMVAIQKAADDSGACLAYCASGTRSSIVWALSQAGDMPVDDILRATAGAGYNLGGLRDQLAQLAKG